MSGKFIAIIVGGSVAGALDLTAAFITYGWQVPRGIASGLIGTAAQNGMIPWILGVVLHFVIAFGAAATFCAVSWRQPFLREHWLWIGPFYGIAVYLVMNLIVVPLSAAPFRGRGFTHLALLQGVFVHMVIIGLPIAFCARRFTR